jgi:lysophospholipase L1-like esterase
MLPLWLGVRKGRYGLAEGMPRSVIVFENTIVPETHYQWDGIHFNAEGHTLVASYLMRQLTAAAKPR